MSVRTIAVDGERLAEALRVKQRMGLRVSVCIPCRNEAATVGSIVAQIVSNLTRTESCWVDELIVMDDGSIDATASVAEAGGATVVAVGDVLPDAGPGSGKGNALWKSVAACSGDVIVWCDGDLLSFTPDYIRRLIAPFVLEPGVALVKAFYERLVDTSGEGGGRNTELVARPALALLVPELADVRQPLSGEYAIRRSVATRLPFAQGYGVEVGLLIDVAREYGADSIAQVDLGVRKHRHRPLRELSPQAGEILHAIFRRVGATVADPAVAFELEVTGRGSVPLRIAERPPLDPRTLDRKDF